MPRVTIMNPEWVREVLSNKFGHFAKPQINPLGRLLATGLAHYEGEKWAKHRRILNPAFHLEKLKVIHGHYSNSKNHSSTYEFYLTCYEVISLSFVHVVSLSMIHFLFVDL